jgi:hypothetical protein
VTDHDPQNRPARSVDWQSRRGFADRLFPGPTAPLTREEAERLRRLVGEKRITPPAASGSASDPAPASAAPADLQKAIEEQNELLRAILASSVDTQTDARATAQNSRTFAWAGIAIAFLTLVASVALVVEALSGS